MPAGKLSAQAGHAYTDALEESRLISPERHKTYRNGSKGGSKVTLKSKNVNQIIKAFLQLKELGIPCALIVDRDHIMPPHFNGEPIITALGVGPCKKEEVHHITKKFQCV